MSAQPGSAGARGPVPDVLSMLRGSWLNLLLLLVPISFILDRLHAPRAWVFLASAAAIIPLAGLIGTATEATSQRTGPALGGLLNATFGNAPELIISLFALHSGLIRVVKASITGSILGNLLLVFGLSMVSGGWGRTRLRFNEGSARSAMGMLMLAVTALVMPAVWDLVVHRSILRHGPEVLQLSLWAAAVLIFTYLASLVYSLITHRDVLCPPGDDVEEAPEYGLQASLLVLLIATVLTAFESELLTRVVEPAAHALGLTELFVGVIVIAIVGNAAEHYTAVVVARKGKMDLAVQIALGSSTQVALFVAPALVLSSLLLGNPMDLVFDPFEIVALALATTSVAFITGDGEANWFKGAQLVAVYALLAIAFYFVPAPIANAR